MKAINDFLDFCTLAVTVTPGKEPTWWNEYRRLLDEARKEVKNNELKEQAQQLLERNGKCPTLGITCSQCIYCQSYRFCIRM